MSEPKGGSTEPPEPPMDPPQLLVSQIDLICLEEIKISFNFATNALLLKHKLDIGFHSPMKHDMHRTRV